MSSVDRVWNHNRRDFEYKITPVPYQPPQPYIPTSSLSGINNGDFSILCISGLCILCCGHEDSKKSTCWFRTNVIAQPIFYILGFSCIAAADADHPATKILGCVFLGLAGAFVAINVGLAIYRCHHPLTEEKTLLQQNQENGSTVV